MKTTSIVFVALLFLISSAFAEVVSFGSGANRFSMEFVFIGNPNNGVDTAGTPNPAGSVPYNYKMGKFEVSRDMVTKASAAGNLGLTLDDMTSFGGNGVNRPATGVSWNEAARFVNWLNTSQGFTPAYKFGTPPDGTTATASQSLTLWASGDSGYNAANPFRNSQSHYFLPSTDEWYKAAYFNPTSGAYSIYPNGLNSPPTAVASGAAANTAVFGQQAPGAGPADVTQTGGLSPYGVMGMGGNVLEWEETEVDLVNSSGASSRGFRGGWWATVPFGLSSSSRSDSSPDGEFNINAIGFRVASVPDPPPPLGDYNRNGTVDAADYTTWRDSVGDIVTPGTGADANFNGFVENSEYFPWKDHFGDSIIGGAGSRQFAVSVPEPSTFALFSRATHLPQAKAVVEAHAVRTVR